MSAFNDLGNAFKNSVRIGDIIKGGTFEINTESQEQPDDFDLGFDDEYDEEEVQKYSNPCSTTFDDLRSGMEKLSDYVYKKTTKPGQGTEKIDIYRNRITYHYNIYLEKADRPCDSTHLRGFPEILCLPLEQDAIVGIQEAISSMVKKEEALFCISYQAAFGPLGCLDRYPPKSDILVDIKIMKVENVGDDKVAQNFMTNYKAKSFQTTLEDANEVYIKARDLFKRKNVSQAIKSYQKIVQIIETTRTNSDEEKKQQQEFLVKVYTNLCVCYNNKEQPNQTMSALKELKAITNVQSNSKLMFAQGKAHMLLGEYIEARTAFVQAMELKPKDEDIKKAIIQLEAKTNKHKQWEKNFTASFKKVFTEDIQ
ncbi:unnamed protein product [Diamesa hyperborea]